MSRHRHIGRMAAEALDDFDDDDYDDYDEDDHSYHSNSHSSYQRPANPAASFVQIKPAKPTKGKAGKPPVHPSNQQSAASNLKSIIYPTAKQPEPVPAAVAAVHANFNPGDYADDNYIPTDEQPVEQSTDPNHHQENDYDYGDEEEYHDEEDDVDQSAYDYAPVVTKFTPQKSKQSNNQAKKQPNNQMQSKPAIKSTPPRPSNNMQLSINQQSINSLTPTKLTPVAELSPSPQVQRSAADDAATANAAEAIRLEKMRNNPPQSRPLSHTSSQNELTMLSLSRTMSPSPSTPSTPSASALRASASSESLALFANQKRTQSRLAMADAEDKKGGTKPNFNLVVIGHVDAGKSTMMGHLLYKLGVVSQKLIHRYEKESRDMGKSSFAFAWVLDQQAEERARGVTVDVAVQHFETPSRRVTLLDAPGHRDFIPNMISGASQADAAILVVPAVTGEFEGGFSEEGQIREHAVLARSLGVSSLIIAVNKLDTVEWNEDRYKQILALLIPFLRQTGFKEKDLFPIPVSGLSGENLIDRVDPRLQSWYTGPTLVELIDRLPSPKRPIDRPFRLCVTEVFKTQSLGITVAGRIESGMCMKGDGLLIVPINEQIFVKGIEAAGETVSLARAGENVEIGLRELSDSSAISVGSWLCDPHHPIPLTQRIRATILTTNLTRPILQGETCMFYTQSAQEPVVITGLCALLDKATGEVSKTRPRVLGRAASADVEISSQRPIAVELFKDFRELGRFALRRGKETIAVGIVTQIL